MHQNKVPKFGIITSCPDFVNFLFALWYTDFLYQVEMACLREQFSFYILVTSVAWVSWWHKPGGLLYGLPTELIFEAPPILTVQSVQDYWL